MSSENIYPSPPPDALLLGESSRRLATQVLRTFYPRGVWFGSYPRVAQVEIITINGLNLALISPEGGATGQANIYCQKIRVSSRINGSTPVDVWKLYDGDWIVSGLQITSSGQPVAPVLHLRNGIGLRLDNQLSGPVEMVGIFIGGCKGNRARTISDAAFIVSC